VLNYEIVEKKKEYPKNIVEKSSEIEGYLQWRLGP